ncbi:hypothetical protein ABT039_22590 [Streptomyces lasiicapitis]|uniref:hypothetical protein n=1 Tax=Streptomyces lasiicapitis TaxID=1923961 RepID=UPI003327A840
MGLNSQAAEDAVTHRLRETLAAALPGGTRCAHTALLLLNTATGQEEVYLHAPARDGRPGHMTPLFSSQPPHDPFALDLIAALHAHRLHAWQPARDGFMPGVINLADRRASGQIGWAIDLRHLTEDT